MKTFREELARIIDPMFDDRVKEYKEELLIKADKIIALIKERLGEDMQEELTKEGQLRVEPYVTGWNARGKQIKEALDG